MTHHFYPACGSTQLSTIGNDFVSLCPASATWAEFEFSTLSPKLRSFVKCMR